MYFKNNMQNLTISELYIDDKKKYSSSPYDILKSVENFYETLYTNTTSELFSKIHNRNMISNEQFHLCEA